MPTITPISQWIGKHFPPRIRHWLWTQKVVWGNRQALKLDQLLSKRVQQAAKADLTLFERMTSKGEWERFKNERMQALHTSLKQEARHPEAPDSIVTGTQAGNGYRVENIVFQGYREYPVTANLYRPMHLDQPSPGIVICHSHHDSKSEEELQCLGNTLARQGATSLIMDLLGHGERRQHPFNFHSDYEGTFCLDRQDYYFRHNLGMQLHLTGESLMGWMVQDVRHGISLLWADPRIDHTRIILMGSVAGGGNLSALTGALDTRVNTVVAFNFGQLSFGDWDTTRNLPDTARFGFWPWIVLASLAPRRLVYGREFSWNPHQDSVWKNLKRIYTLYGHPDHLRSVHGSGRGDRHSPNDSHCTNIGASHRRQLYTIFQEWFNLPLLEKEESTFTSNKHLTCLTNDIPNTFRMPFVKDILRDFTRDHLTQCRQEWQKHNTGRRTNLFLGQLNGVLGSTTPYRLPSKPPKIRKVVNVEYLSLQVDALHSIRLQIIWPNPSPKAPAPAIIGFAQEGNTNLKKTRASLIRGFSELGIVVSLIELYGIGDGRHGEIYRGRLSPSTRAATNSLMLGKSLVASRIQDVRTAMAYLRERKEIDENRLGLWGDSLSTPNPGSLQTTVPLDAHPSPIHSEPLGGIGALLVAAFEPGIKAVYTHGSLFSYEALLKEACIHVPADVIIRGILWNTDIPDIVETLAPRPLWMESLVDEHNRLASKNQLEAVYGRARLAYAQAETPERLTINNEQASSENLPRWFQYYL